MTFKSVFPFNQELVAEYPLFTEREVASRLQSSGSIYKQWSALSYSQRADLFKKLAGILRQEKDKLARLITMEMGKVTKEALSEIEKCAMCCDHYAEHGEAILQNEIIQSDASLSYVSFQPIGIVFAVMPWNFPFWQVFRYAVPTLLAGNVTLLKHAPNVCGCALAIESIFLQAGFPEGVFQTLIMDVSLTEKVIQSDDVQGVTLTGSEYAGSSVASLAGKHIKKTVMELGGSDPFIVLVDAEIDVAARWAVQSRMQNAGQSCIAAKRFIVQEQIFDQFASKVDEILNGLKQGNPLLEGITMGPLARLDLAEKLEKQYCQTIKSGARAVTEYYREGCNISPLLMTEVPHDSIAANEETFGPLMALFRVSNDQETIDLANASRYGLGASIWTKDIEKAQSMASRIQAGGVFVNAMVKSDPHLPFGGSKKSGYGRELSHFGMREFTNVQTVYIG